MRQLYWYLSTFLKKYGWIILVSVLGAVLVFSLLVPALLRSLGQKNVTYVGLVGDYTLEKLPTAITDKISYGLMNIRETDNEIIPAIAESYQISADGLTYEFVIKDDLTWQDGQPLTAADINYYLPGVETTVQDQHLTYQLTEKFAPFLTNLTKPLLRYEPAKRFGLVDYMKIIGIGDYQLTAYKNKDQSANKLKEVTIESPEEKIIYRFYLTEEQAIAGFKKGEVDQVLELSSVRDLASWSNVVITEENNQDQYLGLFFNLNTPELTRNVRQAFSYAINKGPGDKVALGPISNKSWAFFKGSKRYDYSLEKAIERLVVDFPGEPIDLELTVNSLNYGRAETIKQELEELGFAAADYCRRQGDKYEPETCDNLRISITIKVDNFPSLIDYQLLLIGQASPLDPDQYTLWHSDQVNNFTNYKNTRADALLENGRQTLDKKERTAIYQEFQQVLLEDAPAAFLEYITTFSVARL